MGATQEDAAAAATVAEAEEASSTNQRTQSLKGCSSSLEKNYSIGSPLKKRKSQYDLVDSSLLSLKYKFRKRFSRLEDESATTESIGCDGFLIDKNCGTDMVSIPEELDSSDNTLSLFGGCIVVDSKNGIESQSMRKMLEARLSLSGSSSNIFSSDASSSGTIGTKETESWIMSASTKQTESWIMQDDEYYHPDLVLQQHDNDFDRMYDVLEQYGDLMDGGSDDGDVHGSASRIMDEKLYSNGVDDFQILPTGQNSSHGAKKLTIDQEFEQYFSRLML